MATASKQTPLSNVEVKHRNLVRGMLGAAKDHGFTSDPIDRTEGYWRNYRSAMLSARLELPPERFSNFLDWLETQVKEQLPTNILRRAIGYNLLNGIVDAKEVSFEKEVGWVTARILSSKEKLCRFRDLATQFEQAVLAHDARLLRATTFAIRRLYGQSLWLIETQIALRQTLYGLERQKSYVDGVKAAQRRGVAPYIAHYLSVRNEPTVTLSR